MAALKLVGVVVSFPFFVTVVLLSVVTSGVLAIPVAPLMYIYFKRG